MPKTIRILYEDDYYVVFDKPAGLLVIPSPSEEKRTLTRIVNDLYAHQTQYRLHPCHRLDRETSGVIVFAKGKKWQKKLMEEFHKGAVEKKYIAFVKGGFRKSRGEIKTCIQKFHQKRFQSAARRHIKVPRGKSALTRYLVISEKKEFSVIEVQPVTGRTNQIRIHFSEMGHPVLGERVYAFRRDFKVDFRRLALHSHELIWTHPVTGKKVKVVSQLAEDMSGFLDKY